MPQFNPAAMLTTTAIVLFPVLATDAVRSYSSRLTAWSCTAGRGW